MPNNSPNNSPNNRIVSPLSDKHLLAGQKILYVINANSGGGVEHLAESLEKDQHLQKAVTQKLFLYGNGQDGNGQGGNGKVSKTSKILGILKTLKDIVRFRPDILITFQPTSSVIASVVARLIGCRIRIIHQSNLPRLTHKVPRFLDRLAGSTGFYSVIIMNSLATRQAFDAYPKAYQRKLYTIPHGIEWTAPVKTRAEIRREYNIPADKAVLFSCARLSKEKSLETIIETLPALPDVWFMIAGDGPYKQVLHDRAKALGVLEQIKFLGHISHKQLTGLHLAADLFVFPSRSETFGMAAVEAAMSGMVIISSDIAPMREVLTIKGKSAAIFVKDWKAESWTIALSQILNRPDTQKNNDSIKQAQSLAPKIRALYSTDKMLEKYRILYIEILHKDML